KKKKKKKKKKNRRYDPGVSRRAHSCSPRNFAEFYPGSSRRPAHTAAAADSMGAAPTPDASAMAAAAAAAAAADPHDMHRLALMASMTSALSLLGSSALILTFAFFRSYRSQAARVTCYLAVADLITAVAKLIGHVPDLMYANVVVTFFFSYRAGFSGGGESALCQAQGAGIFWGDLSSCLWVTILGINLLLILCFSRTVADLRRYEVYYVMIGYGAPLLFAVPPLFVRGPPMYANSGLWCWISFEYKYWRIILLFAPLWALFAFNAAVYILSARIIWKRSAVSRTLAYGSSALASFRRTYARNVSFYIAAYVISW
ncbi:MAG: hypothetical protein BJ554DRAFT_363, partial [Olpidium bornovanus]